MRANLLRSSAAVLAGLAALAVATGCGSARSAAAGAHVIPVPERASRISAPARIPAGEVIVRVHNGGPDEHELIATRVPANWKLPLRGDGFTVDEDAVQSS